MPFMSTSKDRSQTEYPGTDPLLPASFSFRDQAQTGDAEAVRRLTAETKFFNAEESAVAMELVMERLRLGAASGYEFIFADDGPALGGYACFGPIPGTLASWDLYWIAVAPRLQGRGLGRELLARCEAAIAGAEGQRVYIETASREQYAATRAFYLRNGYQQEAMLADFYAPGDGKIIYLKTL